MGIKNHRAATLIRFSREYNELIGTNGGAPKANRPNCDYRKDKEFSLSHDGIKSYMDAMIMHLMIIRFSFVKNMKRFLFQIMLYNIL